MEFREFFQFDAQMIHLNNAGCAALPLRARDRLKKAADELAMFGGQINAAWNVEQAQAREAYARFLGTTATRVAFTPNLATGMSMVAWGLPFRRGDVILSLDQEYPSNAYPWLAVAQAKDLKMQIHASRGDLSVDWSAFLEKIKPGVRAVAISWVQFKAGTTAPLELIGAACRAAGAWLIVDSIQGMGVQPLNWNLHQADVVCGGSHKWMCGPTGHGFLAFKDDFYQQMPPLVQGAMTFGTPDDAVDPSRAPIMTASRFEPGCTAHMLTMTAAQSLAALSEFGIDRIHRHALSLSQILLQELSTRGWQIWGDPLYVRISPIVTFSGKGISEVSRKLFVAKISHAFRNQSVRLSPHGFNTAEEMTRALEVIGAPSR